MNTPQIPQSMLDEQVRQQPKLERLLLTVSRWAGVGNDVAQVELPESVTSRGAQTQPSTLNWQPGLLAPTIVGDQSAGTLTKLTSVPRIKAALPTENGRLAAKVAAPSNLAQTERLKKPSLDRAAQQVVLTELSSMGPPHSSDLASRRQIDTSAGPSAGEHMLQHARIIDQSAPPLESRARPFPTMPDPSGAQPAADMNTERQWHDCRSGSRAMSHPLTVTAVTGAGARPPLAVVGGDFIAQSQAKAQAATNATNEMYSALGTPNDPFAISVLEEKLADILERAAIEAGIDLT